MFADRGGSPPLMIGSVKTNVGHLEGAAGVTGLVKLVLSLRQGTIPPHLHFRTPSPHIPWSELPIEVPIAATKWKPIGGRRIGGVSSFGFSGTNAHVIVEEAPPAPARTGPVTEPADRPWMLAMSARNETALAALAGAYADVIEASTVSSLPDICFTGSAGRAQHPQRATIIARSTDEMRLRLRALAEARASEGVRSARVARRDPPRIAFLYTGQGSQYTGMARGLYENMPVFRSALDRCADLLGPHLRRPLRQVLYPGEGICALLEDTEFAQPALFSIQYALTELWRSWGVAPSTVMGHSVGEFAAACAAGAFSLEDGLRLVAARGRLMQSLPAGGAMAAIFASEAVVVDTLVRSASATCIAAINGPAQTVISGPAADIESICRQFAERGMQTQRLQVSHAFHSKLIEPMLDAFEAEVASVRFAAPSIRLISNVSGSVIDSQELAQSRYWRRHARDPVRFADGISALASRVDCIIEIGPHPTLLSFAGAILDQRGPVRIASLRRGADDCDQILAALGSLYFEGARVDWRAVTESPYRHLLDLPTYPFQRERYWFQARPADRRALSGQDTGHALLGEKLRSAASVTIYESHPSADHPAFIRHHRVLGRIVLPATAYLETLLACGREQFRSDSVAIQDVVIREAMLLPDNGAARVMQTVCSPAADGALDVSISSIEDSEHSPGPWSLHASARVQASAVVSPPPVDLAKLREVCNVEIDPSKLYGDLDARGVAFGSSFRVVRQLWAGDSQSLGRLELDQTPASSYTVHPALLDGCLQTASAALSDADSGSLYLPIGIQRISWHRRASARCWTHAVVHPSDGETRRADLRIFDDQGVMLAEVSDARFKRVQRDALERLGERWLDEALYEVQWEEAVIADERASLKSAGQTWLVFADQGGVGGQVAGALAAKGEQVLTVRRGGYALQAREAAIDPAVASDCRRLFGDLQDMGRTIAGILHFWSLDIPSHDASDTDALAAAQTIGSLSVLHIAQSLVEMPSPASLWVVTRGAWGVDAAERVLAPLQSSVWGLCNALGIERTELNAVCVDLDPSPAAVEVDQLLAEIASNRRERHIALRGAVRRVARIAHLRRSSGSTGATRLSSDSGWRMSPLAAGSLDRFERQPWSVPGPGPGEVLIAVDASALNFKDVLAALGMYPGNAGPLGGECAGRILALGEGVTSLQVGDQVMAVGRGCLASHMVARAELVQRRPANISIEDAAAFSVAYITAEYCLGHLADMKRGDRVLIHAAAGGVGLAAVTLAQRAGAEVFATAGAEWKRERLRALGVRHVFDSRNTAFSGEIAAVTSGHGVDIVLNSLSGEAIDSSFEVLAPGGCFIEIGKRGIKQPAWVESRKRGWKYHIVDWSETAARQPALIAGIYSGLVEQLRDGRLGALPHRDFAVAHTGQAFRFMAQARHVGKIVIRNETGVASFARRDASYLITGGLSGLGLQAARHLAEQGAGHLVLIGRRAPSRAAVEAVAQLRAQGTQVTVESVDVSDLTGLNALLARVREAGPPLRGVLHCAGTYDDASLARQNAERFEHVFRPKVQGAWALDRCTRHDSLDWFVLFSSIASVLGAPGQCNYAAANAFLDTLAQQRRMQGLPALSINWCAWSQTGAAAERGLVPQMAAQGLGALETSEALLALQRLIESGCTQAVMLPVDWPRFLGRYPQGLAPPLFEHMIATEPKFAATTQTSMSSHSDSLKQQLADAPALRRRSMVAALVREHALRVLGAHSSKSIDPRAPLGEMGLDSLLAVELRNALSGALAVPLPATLLFDYPSIDAMTDYLLSEVLHLLDEPEPEPASPVVELVDSIEAMSDEHVDRLIAARGVRVLQ